VEPRDGLCGAGPDRCCECFKLKIEGSLMAIGGYNPKPLRSAEVLNTSCNFPLPKGRHGHIGVTTADSRTLFCGGFLPSESTVSCLEFNFQSKTWEHHSNMSSPRPWGSPAIALKRGVYVLFQDDTQSSSEFLATGSSVWTRGPDVPGKGVYLSCVARLSEAEFVLLGGRNDETQALHYSETSGLWTELTRLTVGVIGHSCLGLGDKVLIVGGRNTTRFKDATGRTFIFDTKTGSAREVASLKYPRIGGVMVLYRGKPLILGGTTHEDYGWRSDGEIWNMDTETWEEADIELNVGRDRFSLVTMAEEIDCD